MNAPTPGIYCNVAFADYLRWPLMSQTTLKEGRTSMAHLKARLDGERVIEPTDDMLLGSALHCAFLEPELMPTKVILWDGGTRRGKEWDAFKAAHTGKVILTETMHEKLVGMIGSLRRHKQVRDWVQRMEGTEVSCVGEIEGLPMKGRIDALTDDPIIDLKKVASADPFLFRSKALDYGYHIQAAVYCHLFNRGRMTLITVEDSPPFDVVAYPIGAELLEAGREEASGLIQRVQWCMKNNEWPGRCPDIEEPLGLPEWAKREAFQV